MLIRETTLEVLESFFGVLLRLELYVLFKLTAKTALSTVRKPN